MNARALLLILLVISTIIEFLFPLGGFLAPAKMLEIFQVGVTNDTLFLTFILAWALGFVAIVCALAARLVWGGEPLGWTLSYLLGLWWIGIGVTLFVVHGRVDNLFLDALKGALIVAAAWRSRTL
jgi:hypothetical protein